MNVREPIYAVADDDPSVSLRDGYQCPNHRISFFYK